MVNLKKKTILKLLLIITMVIQPVVFSYAMVSMDHSHHMSSLAHSYNGDHVMNENMVDTHDQNIHEDDSEFDNCCNTAACNPAAVVSATTAPYGSTSQTIVSIVSMLRSIDLITEIKPPRSLPG